MPSKAQYLLFTFTFICFSLLIIDCSGGEHDQKIIVRSFYHWKSDFTIDKEQQDFLNDLEVEEIYLHLFDVIWDGEKDVPTAVTQINSKPSQKLIPVVYITTDVFKKLDSAQIANLAFDLSFKLKKQMTDYDFEEVQIDCDWMPSIKDKYFYWKS